MKRKLKCLLTVATGSLLLSEGGLSQSAENVKTPLLGISIAPTRTQFEAGQRVECVLEITNLNSTPVVLPSFRFIQENKGTPYSVVPLYVEEQILNEI
jgi:hypothetical protein